MEIAQKIKECYLIVSDEGFKTAIEEVAKSLQINGGVYAIFDSVKSLEDYEAIERKLLIKLQRDLKSLQNDIYLQVASEILRIDNKISKNLFVSDVYYLLTLFYLDIQNAIKDVVGSSGNDPFDDLQNPELGVEPLSEIELRELMKQYYSFGDLPTGYALKMTYLQRNLRSFHYFIYAYKERFGQYINSATKQLVEDLKEEIWFSRLGLQILKDKDVDEKKDKAGKLSLIKWTKKKADFNDLVVGLVESKCIELTEGDSTKEQVGAYLYRLFNIYPDFNHKKYHTTIQDIYTRTTQKQVFLNEMLNNYNEFKKRKKDKSQSKGISK